MKRSYRVLARLGEGGMATVYLGMIGKAGGFRKLVALKVLRDQSGVSEHELRETFAREARVSARCHHRNVVQILDVCELDGKPALCMEYLDGQTYRQLRARATKTGTLPLFEQLRILCETAHGLHHVHTLKDYEGRPLGLVHCDVSPENVFITYDGQVKLLDFGIAKLHGEERAPGFQGKLSYLAPELIRGENVDARADVFALGAMLWEAVCAVPFAGGPTVDELTKLRNRLTGAEGKIRGIEPSAPEALIQIVDRAIALEPAQRFPDAQEFATALESYLELIHAHPSAQSLSKLITPMFVREAAKLTATIEPQLALSDRWDREHDGAQLARSIVTLGKRADPPDAPFDFSLQERITFEPLASTTAAPEFASPSDTVVPWRDNLERMKRYAPLLAVVFVGILGGAILGFRESSPKLVANPASVQEPKPVAPQPVAPKPVAPKPAAVTPPPPPAPVVTPAQETAAPAVLAPPPCVETPPSEPEHHRSADYDERRERRHYERRVRRRAAQCAAGRADKCSPIPEP